MRDFYLFIHVNHTFLVEVKVQYFSMRQLDVLMLFEHDSEQTLDGYEHEATLQQKNNIE